MNVPGNVLWPLDAEEEVGNAMKLKQVGKGFGNTPTILEGVRRGDLCLMSGRSVSNMFWRLYLSLEVTRGQCIRCYVRAFRRKLS